MKDVEIKAKTGSDEAGNLKEFLEIVSMPEDLDGVVLQLLGFKVILGNQRELKTQKPSMYTVSSEVWLTLVQWMMVQREMFLAIVENGQLVNSFPPRININCSHSEKKGESYNSSLSFLPFLISTY